MSADAPVAHIVFFDLNDDSAEARQKLIESAKKYLSGHDGTVYFSVGIIGDGFDRPVNDHDFSVALHVVFENRAAHDVYQTHERHVAYIAENKGNWKRVRVFDSYEC
ncbi:MAG: Dabb family protein [Planctomycetota bacterium]|nr:Dabb family protein [Planctomycetota bacterium]MDA1247847.1 Dabb family protein [Planctomycetota bacterium]